MKITILKSVFLFLSAMMVSLSTQAVERNSSMVGAATSVQTEVNYYLFNLGANLYFGIDYDWTARGAVIKNPFQQVKVHTAGAAGYHNIESVYGARVGGYLFFDRDVVEIWGDQGKEGDMPRRDTYWSLLNDGNGVYQLKNRSALGDTYCGTTSGTDRRLSGEITKDDVRSKWVFIPVGSDKLDLFHAKEALLFAKLNEVEHISGFPANILLSATAVYQNELASLAEVKVALGQLITAQYNLVSATNEAPVNVTALIVNPIIEQTASGSGDRPFGWEKSTNQDGPNSFFVKNANSNTVLEAWGYDYSDVSKFDYNQILVGVPNGAYRLSATCYTEANESGEVPNKNAGIYAFAGGNEAYTGVSALGENMLSTELITVVDHTLRIGVKKNGRMNFRYFTADNFELFYHGNTTPAFSIDVADIMFTELKNSVKFSISALNIISDITISSDLAGLTFTPNIVSASSLNNGSVEVTVNFDPNAVGATSATGLISLANAEAGNKTINIITSKEEDFAHKGKADNLISDPTVSDPAKFGGWGSKKIASIKDEPGIIKSGAFCGKIQETEAGSLDATLVSTLEANTEYTMFAWVNTNGTFNLAVTGATAGAGSDVGHLVPDTQGNWEAVEFTFRTGDNPTGTIAYFNNWGFSGTIGYIDNWELYKKSDVTVGIDETKLDEKISIESIVGGIRIGSAESLNISVFTITGQLFKQGRIEQGETILSLPKGVYIINGQKALAF